MSTVLAQGFAEPFQTRVHRVLRDVARIITKARSRDSEQQKKYTTMVDQLIANGYPAACVDVILKYAANNLWKD